MCALKSFMYIENDVKANAAISLFVFEQYSGQAKCVFLKSSKIVMDG